MAKAIKQRKPYLNRDEGLNLLAIYNSLLGTRNNFNFCYSNVNLISPLIKFEQILFKLFSLASSCFYLFLACLRQKIGTTFSVAYTV